ncbi:MAG: hypothetical protein IRZ14_01345 [Chloroflexi bacterium]|nr:hypothetical protein [Chloroflexota bacterium]
MIAIPVASSFARSRLLVVALALGAALIEAGVVMAVLSGRPNLLAYALALGLVVACFVWWRPAVYGLMVVVFVEGYFRIRFNDPAVLLLKDAMVVAIYLRVFGERLLRREPLVPAAPINPLLLIFLGIVFIQAVNPFVAGPGQALVGLRRWVLYIPLYYVALEMLRTERDVRRFLWFLMACAVPICALAVFQYYAGPAAYAAQGPAFPSATFVTLVGDVWVFRPNATFSWPSHFGEFLVIIPLMAGALLMGTRGLQRFVVVLLLAGLLAVIILESERALYVSTIWNFALLFAIRRQFWALPLAGIVLLGVLTIVDQVTGSIGTERIRELAENRNNVIQERRHGTFLYWLEAIRASPVGLGVGATAIGVRHVESTIPLFIEVPLAKVLADLSLLGLIVYVALGLVLWFQTWRAHERAHRAGAHELAGLLAGMLVFQVQTAMNGYELAVNGVCQWFLYGAATVLANEAARLPTTAPAGVDGAPRTTQGVPQ